MIREAEGEQLKLWHDTAIKALNIWHTLTEPADTNHLYLAKKQVKSHNLWQLRQSAGLFCPYMIQVAKCSSSISDEDGDKRFLSGGKKKGCYFCIGKPKDNQNYSL